MHKLKQTKLKPTFMGLLCHFVMKQIRSIIQLPGLAGT